MSSNRDCRCKNNDRSNGAVFCYSKHGKERKAQEIKAARIFGIILASIVGILILTCLKGV